MLGIIPPDAHQEIIKSLLGQMGGGSNATPSPSNSMQGMSFPNSGLETQGQGADPFGMVQPQPMLGRPQQGSY